MKNQACKGQSRKSVINKPEVPLFVGDAQSIIANKNGAQVSCVGYCLSVIFYAFYVNMDCPRFKVIKCSKFKQQKN